MVEIQTPRMADRKEDLPLLERHFVARFSAQYRKDIRGLTHHAHLLLSQHSWPGNVRELENVVGRAAMMTTKGIIDLEDLPPYLQAPPALAERMERTVPASSVDALEGRERSLILGALEAAGGNQTQAARLLRISRDRLRYKLKKYNLRGPGRGRSILVWDSFAS